MLGPGCVCGEAAGARGGYAFTYGAAPGAMLAASTNGVPSAPAEQARELHMKEHWRVGVGWPGRHARTKVA